VDWKLRPVSLHIGFRSGPELAALELFDYLLHGSRNARVDGDVGRLERRKRLGADVARQNRLGIQSSDGLCGLNACPLRGVEVLRVVVGGKLAGIGIHQYKMLGSAEPWIDLALQTRSFRSDDDFHGFLFKVSCWRDLSLLFLVLSVHRPLLEVVGG
jgi:hypothetical protein